MATGSHPFQVFVQTSLTREDSAHPGGCSASPCWMEISILLLLLHTQPLKPLTQGLHFLSVLSTETLALWTSPCSSFVPRLLAHRTTWEAIIDEWMVFFIIELKSLSGPHLSVTKKAICMFENVKECWEENGAVSTELWLVRISRGRGGGEGGRGDRGDLSRCFAYHTGISLQCRFGLCWSGILYFWLKGIDPAGMWVSIWALENSGCAGAVCTSVTQFFTKMMFPEDWAKVT